MRITRPVFLPRFDGDTSFPDPLSASPAPALACFLFGLGTSESTTTASDERIAAEDEAITLRDSATLAGAGGIATGAGSISQFFDESGSIRGNVNVDSSTDFSGDIIDESGSIRDSQFTALDVDESGSIRDSQFTSTDQTGSIQGDLTITDSGIVADALETFRSIFSAQTEAGQASEERRNDLLSQALEGVTSANQTIRQTFSDSLDNLAGADDARSSQLETTIGALSELSESKQTEGTAKSNQLVVFGFLALAGLLLWKR